MSARCPTHGCGAHLEHPTDHLGRVSAVCPGCRRVAAGRCQDCNAPVPSGRSGTGAKRRRCATCRAVRATVLARMAAFRQYHDPDGRRRRRQLAYMRSPAVRERDNARKRALYQADPEKMRAAKAASAARTREARNAARRAAYARDPEKGRAASRAYHEKHRARENADQRETAALRRRLFAPQPVCVAPGCGVSLPYAGRGMPRKWCAAHRPYRVASTRPVGRQAVAA